MNSLQGRVAIVTGAAGTMGLAATRFLLEDGCRVAMVDANGRRNEELAEQLGSGARAFCFDISDPEAVRAGHRLIVEARGSRHPCQHAGLPKQGRGHRTAMRRVLGANLDGAFPGQRVMRRGARRFGASSTRSLAAKKGVTEGNVIRSKGAVTSLTFSLARELAAYGVTSPASRRPT